MPDFKYLFQQDLLALGVRPGGLLLVHSSYRSLLRTGRPAPDGPEDVIRGLRETLGPDGTLLMPALTYERVTPDRPVFDVRRTPGNVGIIPETFRLSSGTLRSLHPTHSVCAAGRLAAGLTEPHAADDTPCGPHSPFRAVAERGGQILFLGCGLAANTTMHAVEELVMPPYLLDPPALYCIIRSDGSELEKAYRPHNFRGWRQRYDRIAELLGPVALRRGSAAGADSILLDAAGLREAALRALRADPLFFVDRCG
jgi:aminoglycoside 3-N-acetyltransferase